MITVELLEKVNALHPLAEVHCGDSEKFSEIKAFLRENLESDLDESDVLMLCNLARGSQWFYFALFDSLNPVPKEIYLDLYDDILSSESRIVWLAEYEKHMYLREIWSADPDVPLEILEDLFNGGEEHIFPDLAQNRSLPIHLALTLAEYEADEEIEESIRSNLASNQSMSQKVLMFLSDSVYGNVLSSLAANPKSDAKTLNKVYESSLEVDEEWQEEISSYLAEHENASKTLLKTLEKEGFIQN